jgi:hypothetical protein
VKERMFEVRVVPLWAGSVLRPYIRRVRAQEPREATLAVSRSMGHGYKVSTVQEVEAPPEIAEAYDRRLGGGVLF